MLYVIGTLAVTVGLECFILWYGMKYGFIDPKRKIKTYEEKEV